MIVLCGHSVLIEFVWSLGSEDETTVRRAERLVWVVLRTMANPAEFDRAIKAEMDAAACDEMREQLHTHYLMIFDRLNKELMKPVVTTVDANTIGGGGHSLLEKRQTVLRAFGAIIRLIGERFVSFVPKTVAMLKGVMSSDAALQLCVMRVWQTMVDQPRHAHSRAVPQSDSVHAAAVRRRRSAGRGQQ